MSGHTRGHKPSKQWALRRYLDSNSRDVQNIFLTNHDIPPTSENHGNLTQKLKDRLVISLSSYLHFIEGDISNGK